MTTIANVTLERKQDKKSLIFNGDDALQKAKVMTQYNITQIDLCCHIGSSITEEYKNAVSYAKEYKCLVTFEGNGIIFKADEDSEPTLAKEFLDFAYQYDMKELGPRKPNLEPDYMAEIDRIKAERREADRKKWQHDKDIEEYNKMFVTKILINEAYQCAEITEENFAEMFGREHGNPSGVFDYAYDLARLLQIVHRVIPELTNMHVRVCESLIERYAPSGFTHSMSIDVLKDTWALYKKEMFDYDFSQRVDKTFKLGVIHILSSETGIPYNLPKADL